MMPGHFSMYLREDIMMPGHFSMYLSVCVSLRISVQNQNCMYPRIAKLAEDGITTSIFSENYKVDLHFLPNVYSLLPADPNFHILLKPFVPSATFHTSSLLFKLSRDSLTSAKSSA